MNAGSGDVSLCVRDIICSASKYTHKEPFTGIRDPRLPGAGGLREDTEIYNPHFTNYSRVGTLRWNFEIC